MTSDTTTDDYVQLFNRRVPVPALTLLLRLENEGYDIRVDAQTKELCIKRSHHAEALLGHPR